MIYGVDYYPEHWEKSEWEEQAKLMKKGGFNTVRMGEFAWKIFEKEEGKFDFSLLDEAIDVLAKEDIKVILGTPTAAPPKWLVNKYDVLQHDRYGRTKKWGSRRECCANKPDYQEKSRIIVEKMAEHYKENENVIAWQIDNEFGCHASTRCYCESCRRAFAGWLQKKYQSIEKLNKDWGNVFWSLDYDSFEDMILPGYNSCEGELHPNFAHNPSLDLEYRRFASDSWVEYQKEQIRIIRKYTEKPVTHNLMGHFSDINYYDLAKDLDFVSWDNYPDNQWGASEYPYVSMAHEIMRGCKNQNFIVMEQEAGPCGWDIMGSTPRPGQLRLWVYQAIAHGAEGIVFFRFRTALFGMEQYWHGVLDHDGVPRRRFYELVQTGSELQKMENYIVDKKPCYEAMIYRNFDDIWSHEIKRHVAGFDYRDLLYAYYKANAAYNINTAVSNDHFEEYKVVYMPACNVVTEKEIEKAKVYVEKGGTLVLTFRSGTRNKYNNMYPLPMPGLFKELAGIEVEEFDALRKTVSIAGKVKGEAKLWCDVIKTETAEVISCYDSEYYKGKAAITVNTYGKGKVYYVGCDLNEEAMKTLVKLISDNAAIKTFELPEGVEMVKREDSIFLLNHKETETEIPLKGKSLLTGEEFGGRLPGYGVEVLTIN